jgi:hypothetical protein
MALSQQPKPNMRHLLTLLAALLLCSAPAQAQTIKTLGYNTTNGQVVYTGTNVLTFTGGNGIVINGGGGQAITANSSGINFETGPNGSVLNIPADDTVQLGGGVWNDPSVRSSLGFSTNLNTLWTATNTSNARSAVGLGATWLTNTNVTNFRTEIGLGAANNVTFDSVSASEFSTDNGVNGESLSGFGIVFVGNSAAATRTNLGFPLQALTNTSNVTMMRALASSTNTNAPFSGSVSVVGTNNTNTLVFTNGILLEVQ